MLLSLTREVSLNPTLSAPFRHQAPFGEDRLEIRQKEPILKHGTLRFDSWFAAGMAVNVDWDTLGCEVTIVSVVKLSQVWAQ